MSENESVAGFGVSIIVGAVIGLAIGLLSHLVLETRLGDA